MPRPYDTSRGARGRASVPGSWLLRRLGWCGCRVRWAAMAHAARYTLAPRPCVAPNTWQHPGRGSARLGQALIEVIRIRRIWVYGRYMAKAPQPARRYGIHMGIQASLMSSESRCPCRLYCRALRSVGRFLRLRGRGLRRNQSKKPVYTRGGAYTLTHPLRVRRCVCLHTYRARKGYPKRTHPRIRTRVCIRTHCVRTYRSRKHTHPRIHT
jgi:hypothetical protein